MKKLISLIIAATLILALCPMSFATDNSDGYTYIFTLDAFTDGYKNRKGLYEMTYDSLKSGLDSWKVAGSRYLTGVRSDENGLVWSAYDSRADSGSACFAVEIYVSDGGTYLPSLTYYARKCSPIVDIYLVKEKTMAGTYGDTNQIQFHESGNEYGTTYNYIINLDKSYKLKNLDMYGTTEYTKTVTEDFDNIELNLTAGKYYLLFRMVDTNSDIEYSSGYSYVVLNSFKLMPKVEAPVD